MLTLDSAALDRFVHRSTGHASVSVTPMPGGASTRSYLRVNTGERSAIAMFVPDAAPEEVTNGAATSARWPFLEVQELLASRGVRVPAVLGEACGEGLLLLEDLGDETLAAFLLRAPERKAEVYQVAVRDLARAQIALEALPAGSVVAGRAFDEKLLRWELDHFREWGLDARGRALPEAERAELDAIFARLAQRIAAWPRGFVHRDYQSRNLMVLDLDLDLDLDPDLAHDLAHDRTHDRGEGLALVWIDFQDALLGPRVYDLVALLNDSYQSFDRPFVEARLDDYAAARGLDPQGREELGRQFDVVTVQRKLKDAGRFIFIDQVKKNPAFLPYFAPSLAKVRAALARLGDEPDMRALLRVVDRADA